ncbi:DUF3618 domain-containing protein [Sphaerobacter sp.]|uniref:DUF3618 domain-containing protein n=1 Tax=Sphaerobacter sp. TaxID=2099654 RepID=UPI001D513138|nr:DUF3618 domain-containing protein [Sphaerobacter sp.]MBX5444530.1 DUF3618 domain-containing protein [Sphaerobacter sp.]
MRDPFERPDDVQPPDADQTPDEIRDDIEDTRADMSETIDAIQERLSPEHLKDQAKESVREATIGRAEQMASDMGDTARQTGGGIIETIKQNPIPAALAAVGIGMLWRNRQSASQPSSRPRHVRYDEYGRPVPRTYADDERAESRGGGAGQAVSQAQERAGEMASQVQGRAGEVTGEMQHQMHSARSQLDRLIDEKPLAVTVAALGLGAAVGLAIPETQREREMMGPARDTVMEKAQDAAQQTMGKAQQVAESAQQSAKDAAKEQGLTQ